MIHVQAKNIKEAWQESLRRLYNEGENDSERGRYRSSPAVVEIDDTKGEHYDEFYPLPVADIAENNRYFISGYSNGNQDDVSLLYRDRIFGKRESERSQIDRVIDYLKRSPEGKNALIPIWREEDMCADTAPNLYAVLFRISKGALDLHVHNAGSDAYRHFLPDMSRFATLQHHTADRIGIPHGKYAYFADSLHFNMSDKDIIDLLLCP